MIFSDKLDSGGIRKVLEFNSEKLEESNRKVLDIYMVYKLQIPNGQNLFSVRLPEKK